MKKRIRMLFLIANMQRTRGNLYWIFTFSLILFIIFKMHLCILLKNIVKGEYRGEYGI